MVRQSILKGLLILYGIYVVMIGKEIVRKGKAAYIYWPYEDPAQDFMEYRNFMWIEKEA